VSFDERAAWTGTLDGAPAVPFRIEAASWKGGPVYFELVWPWMRPPGESVREVAPAQRFSGLVAFLIVFVVVPLAAGLVAWRHYRSQRGDLQGAVRLGTFTVLCSLLGSLTLAHHIAGVSEVDVLIDAVSSSLVSGTVIGVLYVALEPYVRRRWPQSLISWTRLLGGGIRDPIVNGQVLVGIACGVVSFLVVGSTIVLTGNRESGSLTTLALQGAGPAMGIGLYTLVAAIQGSLFVFFLIFLVRTLLWRDWLAAAVIVGLVATAISGPLVARMGSAFMVAFGMWVLLRFGVLPLVAGAFTHVILLRLPITLDLSVWYAGASVVALGSILALSVWSFRFALGGRRVWQGDLLES
jgi:serine/threonine-protein kinase